MEHCYKLNLNAFTALLNSSYRAPAPKKLEDIMTSDAGDESLKKYKEKLLGTNAGSVVIGGWCHDSHLSQLHFCTDAKNPKNVIVRSLTLIAEGRDEITMYLGLCCDACFLF
jgi:hypothetical protein